MKELSKGFEEAFQDRASKMSLAEILRFMVAVPLYQLASLVGGPKFRKEVMFVHLESCMKRLCDLKSAIVSHPEADGAAASDPVATAVEAES